MSSEHLSTERAGTLGALALGTDLAQAAILGTVRDVHGAVSRRVRGVSDLVAGHRTEEHARHGGISGAVYGGLGAALGAVTTGLQRADRAGIGARLEESPRGRFVVSALNGLFGDRIRDAHPELAITMAVRRRGRDVALDTESLRAAFPEATGDLVVFLHGLSETESYWDRRRHETGGSYGERLAGEGWSPVYLRANSGLTLSENGVAMAAVMDDLVAAWPVEVRRIALVGHSMGGLIMRSACAVVTDADPAWNLLVTDVVTLGTPHLGAPIARALTAGSSGLPCCPSRRLSAGSSTTARWASSTSAPACPTTYATCRTPATTWSPAPSPVRTGTPSARWRATCWSATRRRSARHAAGGRCSPAPTCCTSRAPATSTCSTTTTSTQRSADG